MNAVTELIANSVSLEGFRGREERYLLGHIKGGCRKSAASRLHELWIFMSCPECDASEAEQRSRALVGRP